MRDLDYVRWTLSCCVDADRQSMDNPSQPTAARSSQTARCMTEVQRSQLESAAVFTAAVCYYTLRNLMIARLERTLGTVCACQGN